MSIDSKPINISLDSSVKHITRVACMALSGNIVNGILFTKNPSPNIVIYKDMVDFGICMDPELQSHSGLIFTNYYKEYNRIVYRFGANLKCSFWTKTIDYVGVFPPSVPDDERIFNLIYPRFS